MTTIAAAAAGAWLWGKFGARVTERAGKLLGDAGRQAWKMIDLQSAAERYRGNIQMLYGTMRIIGMAMPVPLADIFTDVYLLDKPSAWRRYSIEELQRWYQSEDEHNQYGEKRHDALDLVNKHQQLMILGKPGAGKTTLLKYLVLQCTTGKLDLIPIFVGLKSWTDSSLTLMPFLASQFEICAFPNAEPFIEHLLTEGKALILFDGLDEVNLERGARARVVREIRDFADQYPLSRCVITCRTAASDYQFERFSYCELADFTESQMQIFATQWFKQDEAKRVAFLAEFSKDEHHRLRDLGRTPLLLTLLCLAFDETMTFPLRRVEIYEEAVDALLKKWDASRSIKRDTIYRLLSLGHKRQMLARIAVETFANNEMFMRQVDLTKRIVTYLEKLPQAGTAEEVDGEVILRSIEAQHGLLVERAQRIYSFSHLTFHEYFAARYIAGHPSNSMFRSVIEHAHEVRWREVLLLTISMLDDAESFFDVFEGDSHERIRSNKALLSITQWRLQKAYQVEPQHQHTVGYGCFVLSICIIYLNSLLKIAQDLSSVPIGDFKLQYAHDHAIANVSTLASELQNAESLTKVLANISANGSELAAAIGSSHSKASIYSSSLARVLASAHSFATSIAHHNRSIEGQKPLLDNTRLWIVVVIYLQQIIIKKQLGLNISEYNQLQRILEQNTTRSSLNLINDLSTLSIPTQDDNIKTWRRFEADLRSILLRHELISENWLLDNTDLTYLEDYLKASNRMLECLDLAAVADRDAIRNRLLLPPQP